MRFVKGQMAVGHREDLYQVRDQRFLGDEGFVDRVARERNDGPSYVYDISIQELVVHVSSVFGMSVETVCSMTRNREGAWGRGIVGYVGKNLCGYSNKSFAEYFNRDSVVMSRGIGKVEWRAGSDKDFEAKLRRLEGVITLGQKRKKKKLVMPDPKSDLYPEDETKDRFNHWESYLQQEDRDIGARFCEYPTCLRA